MPLFFYGFYKAYLRLRYIAKPRANAPKIAAHSAGSGTVSNVMYPKSLTVAAPK